MSLEEEIIAWSASRPSWQRAVLRRVAAGEVFSEQDYDAIVDSVLTSAEAGDMYFGLEQLPAVSGGGDAVSLISIADPEHVNALESKTPLTFEPTGLTIIFGDNGSGKSGYARLLKRIARARHQEEILSDVFRDTALAKARAALTVRIGGSEHSFTWPDSKKPELQRMLFYDEACGSAILATESDFPYRPAALFVMDGLIQACIAIRSRIDAKLDENAQAAKTLPMTDDDVEETELGKYLASLSASSSLEVLDGLVAKLSSSAESIDSLREDEARLRAADTVKERQKLIRQSVKLDSVKSHIESLQGALGDDAFNALQKERGELKAVEESANLLAQSLSSEPLLGVGALAWKELWESARRFSQTIAYPNVKFPVVKEGSRCVLCQQSLEQAAAERLSRFERFMQDDTQTRLYKARSNWDERVRRIKSLRTIPEAVETHLNDLESDHAELVREVRALIATYESARLVTIDALGSANDIPLSGITTSDTNSRLDAAAGATRAAAEGLSNPELIKERLKSITKKRKELELLQQVKIHRGLIADEVERLKKREALEVAKSAAATGPITKKILDLSEDNITEVVRDSFTRETDRLNLERVTIARTRADKGALLHQPKLVGARQNVTLPRVFSEGERTALGLAGFFTEAQLDASKSALILDDPVTSLDHIRRGRVAARLAALAETRQVVVFTHDISFVADLNKECDALGVPVGERSVTRARQGEKQPGTCSMKHPWKARDVKERLGDLRNELSRIKKDSSSWDDETYEKEIATWAGNLSETWERIISQEVVGAVLADGGMEVRPKMVRVLARFSDTDDREFQSSYSRVSQWVKRHDKSNIVNYVAPGVSDLEEEFRRVEQWFKRVKGYSQP